MADDANFRVELDDLDRVGNVHLPQLVAIAERVIQALLTMPDSLPLSEAFPNVNKINQDYTGLRDVLTDKHVNAAQVLQETARALSEIARTYRVADGQP